MLYNGDAVQVPACQSSGNHRKGDSTLCTLDAFFGQMDRMTPKDYEFECRTSEKIQNDWDD